MNVGRDIGRGLVIEGALLVGALGLAGLLWLWPQR